MTNDSLLSVLLHPLTVIWLLVAILLLGMSRPRRGGNLLPYVVDPLMMRAGPVQPSPAEVSAVREPVYAGPQRIQPEPYLVGQAEPYQPEPYQPEPYQPERHQPAEPYRAVEPVQVRRAEPLQPRRRQQPPAPVPAPAPARVSVPDQSQNEEANRTPDPIPVASGHDVIDLAIRESRKAQVPITPRRRRVNSR